MSRTSSCPSRLALERAGLSGEDPGGHVAAHLASCDVCRSLAQEQRAWGEAYMSSPAARALKQRLDDLDADRSKRPDRSGVWAWAAGGSLAAVATSMLVLTLTSRPPSSQQGRPRTSGHELGGGQVDVLSPKGTAALSLWVGDGDQAGVELGATPILHPGDRVQPAFGAPDSGFVALLMTTPAGARIQVYPAGKEQAGPVQAQALAPLGPSFRLDDELGPYLVVAYFSDQAFSTTALLAQGSRPDHKSFAGLVLVRPFEVRR